MRIVRWFFGLVILAALGAGVAYYYAGTLDGPAITINQPSVIGQGGTLDVSIDAPAAELTTLTIQLEQKGKVFPVLDMATAESGALVTEGDRIRITRPIGKKTLPELESGDLLSNANTIILMGKTREGSRMGRALHVAKHRGSACDDSIVPFEVTTTGLKLQR